MVLETSQNANYHVVGRCIETSIRGSGGRCRLHIISRKKLLDAETKHSGIGTALDAWYRIAKSAQWKSLQEVRQTYSSADGVPVGDKVYTVFNIGGNDFRLVVGINYETQTIFIKHVFTHAEYDKEEWKK